MTFEKGETDAGGGTLSFAPGDRSLAISLATIEDGMDEQDETVSLTLSAPAAGVATLGDPSTATGKIADTDSPPTVSVAPPPAAVTEGGGNLKFAVTLSGASSRPVTVSYGLGGTATEGEDYADNTASGDADEEGGAATEDDADAADRKSVV